MMRHYSSIGVRFWWSGVLLTVLLVFFWVRSTFERETQVFVSPRVSVHFEPGRIGVEHFAQPHYFGASAPQFMWLYSDWAGGPLFRRTEVRTTRWPNGRPTSIAVFIPYSLPFVLVGVATCWSMRRHWQQLRRERMGLAGLCPECLYDLRGNTSGVCPECGEEIAPG